MGDIVIIGGGFAGQAAGRVFARARSRLGGRRVLLVDARSTRDFLPVLPDVAGGRVRSKSVQADLSGFGERYGINVTPGEVTRLDPTTREIFLSDGRVLSYEFCVIACGSVTHFYGMADVARHAFKLDSVADAIALKGLLDVSPSKRFVIVGGGYTGVEIASNIALALKRRRTPKPSVAIVEKGEDILAMLPVGVRDHIRAGLGRYRVAIHTECSLLEVTESRARLSNGLIFEDAAVIWAAGVVTPPFVQALPWEKDHQGRIKVDATLRCDASCFAAGDAASFDVKKRPLRMAVQFALTEGAHAAKNIVRLIAQKPLARYLPVDLGFIVPLAPKDSCGRVFRIPVKGWVGWLFHYFMCVMASFTWGNRRDLVADIARDNRVLRRWR
jgi:NADH dehydrogenase